MSWFSELQNWTGDTFGDLGLGLSLLALFLVAFAESSFSPVPPDILVISFVLRWPHLFWAFALTATVGSVLGGLFGYWVGQRGGRPLLLRHFRPERVAAAEAYFDRWGGWAVAIAGFSPIPYKIFTITAGALGLDRRRFLVASTTSRGARFFLEATLLFLFQEQFQEFIDNSYFNLITLAGVAGLVGVLWLRARLANQKKPAPADESGAGGEGTSPEAGEGAGVAEGEALRAAGGGAGTIEAEEASGAVVEGGASEAAVESETDDRIE